MRARWVELPNCAPGTNDEEPLAADLHNASKATCKTLEKEVMQTLSQSKTGDANDGLPPGLPEDEGARNAAYWNHYPPPYIYDPVIHAPSSAALEDHHH